MADKKNTWDDIPSLEIDDGDTMSNINDKRIHERLTINELKKLLQNPNIPVIMFSAKTGLIEGVLIDISQSGCKTKINKHIAENETIDMLISLPNIKIKCKAIVRWVHNTVNAYNVGLKFLNISPIDSDQIKNMISNYHLSEHVKK